jgi:hypothetical protein
MLLAGWARERGANISAMQKEIREDEVGNP